MATKARDHPVGHPADRVLAHEAVRDQRIEHQREVDIVERQHVELQLQRPPFEPTLTVGGAPQRGIGHAQGQAARALSAPQLVVTEELGLDRADAGHAGALGPKRREGYFRANCYRPVNFGARFST
ncbi:MAG: hypothetical protein JO055_10030 [Alphaproteobacteria bacterium]|nr:hypothetical protein [Alphaproteobacteria bacterium]